MTWSTRLNNPDRVTSIVLSIRLHNLKHAILHFGHESYPNCVLSVVYNILRDVWTLLQAILRVLACSVRIGNFPHRLYVRTSTWPFYPISDSWSSRRPDPFGGLNSAVLFDSCCTGSGHHELKKPHPEGKGCVKNQTDFHFHLNGSNSVFNS